MHRASSGKAFLRHFLLVSLVAAWAAPSAARTAIRCGTTDVTTYLAKPGSASPGSADLPVIAKVYSGKPNAVMVRVAFTDAPYPMSLAGIARVNDTVNTMFLSMSRNQFQFTFKMFPTVLLAPYTRDAAVTDFNGFKAFVDRRLKEAGYVKDGTGDKGYSAYIATFPGIDIGWGGLSFGPGDGANFIAGDYNGSYAVHELGHALGLPHSHSVEAGRDVFGTPGTISQHVEYGDVYDIMGWAWPLDTHYNANYKWRLGWLDKDEAREIRNTGVYRLHAHDNPIHKGRLLAIRVPSTDPRYAYWIEYRAAYPGARGGAVIMFDGFMGSRSGWESMSGLHILDLTPGSRGEDDFEDAVLTPGKSLKDKYGTATFKVLAVDPGLWSENGWADVEVTIPGSIPVVIARPEPWRVGWLPAKPGLPAPGKPWSILGRRLRNIAE